jgi:acyl dehydratase
MPSSALSSLELTESGGAPLSVPMDFEDFRLGQRFAGGHRIVSAEDLEAFVAISGDVHPLHTDPSYAQAQGYARPVLHGPFGLSAFFGWHTSLGLANTSIIGLLDTHWQYLAPICVGDEIHFEMTIARLRRTSSGDRGVIGRAVRLLNQEGVVVQKGLTAVLVRTRDAWRRVGQEPCTPAWAELMARRLNESGPFTQATATWDGTLGLAAESDEVHFRIYRGKVIDTGKRTPLGSTFTVSTCDLTWAELLAASSPDYMVKAMKGAFNVRGNVYEYVRLTKAISLLIDEARALYQMELCS